MLVDLVRPGRLPPQKKLCVGGAHSPAPASPHAPTIPGGAMRSPRLAAIAVVAFGASYVPAADIHRDASNGFRVQVPDRWDSTSTTAVAALNSAVMRFMHQSINYTACFVPRGHTSTDLPRILIQWQP